MVPLSHNESMKTEPTATQVVAISFDFSHTGSLPALVGVQAAAGTPVWGHVPRPGSALVDP